MPTLCRPITPRHSAFTSWYPTPCRTIYGLWYRIGIITGLVATHFVRREIIRVKPFQLDLPHLVTCEIIDPLPPLERGAGGHAPHTLA